MTTDIIATTDDEIAAAITRWLAEHPVLPTERVEPVIRFRYADGTGGAIRWEPEQSDWTTDIVSGKWFHYFFRTDRRYVDLRFTPEFFTDAAVPVIALLHEEARRAMALAESATP